MYGDSFELHIDVSVVSVTTETSIMTALYSTDVINELPAAHSVSSHTQQVFVTWVRMDDQSKGEKGARFACFQSPGYNFYLTDCLFIRLNGQS